MKTASLPATENEIKYILGTIIGHKYVERVYPLAVSHVKVAKESNGDSTPELPLHEWRATFALLFARNTEENLALHTS